MRRGRRENRRDISKKSKYIKKELIRELKILLLLFNSKKTLS